MKAHLFYSDQFEKIWCVKRHGRKYHVTWAWEPNPEHVASRLCDNSCLDIEHVPDWILKKALTQIEVRKQRRSLSRVHSD